LEPRDLSSQTETDDDLDALFDAISPYWRGIAKACLIAIMMATAIGVASNSIWKSLVFGAIIFFVACFNTWRRYLQPISFVLFLAAMAYVCVDFSWLPKISIVLAN
jgi:ABC-type proline/glycine betaine transport system permease subunit